MSKYRTCAGMSTFNTGNSVCPLDPGKVKAIILMTSGQKLPTDLTAAELEKLCHADRPNRIYPLKTIVEYAPSGGEAQTSAVGYGPTKITGYSPKTDTWTLESADLSIKANLAKARNAQFDAYFVDDNNVIYGIQSNDGTLAGVPMTGVYPGGQDFTSSGQNATLTVTTMFKDYEKFMKDMNVVVCDFDVVEALHGVVFVDFVKEGDGNGYKILEHYGKLDITEYYGEALVQNKATALPDASDVTYADGVLTITGDASLAAPSVLQEAGIVGIEQY